MEKKEGGIPKSKSRERTGFRCEKSTAVVLENAKRGIGWGGNGSGVGEANGAGRRGSP